ncbi:PHOsphatase [Mortierella polycephala]|uniref:Multiple inositol polyphosphate phosphatase 1 n=1 Tax=Mortierella polycephala TaxID=41804 RepID=A0A9P6PWT3_9FUNG|nr:PHOsphatase [Mortierella polycephala]
MKAPTQLTPINPSMAPAKVSKSKQVFSAVLLILSLSSVVATVNNGHAHDLMFVKGHSAAPGNAAIEAVAEEIQLEKRAPSRPLIGQMASIRQRLGTKSPYPHEDRPTGHLRDTPKGYELAQVHVVCRHGTRYPGDDDSGELKELAKKLSNTTVPGFNWIRKWSTDAWYPPLKGDLLAARGDSDLYEIGRRFAKRYESFLDLHPYDANTFEFRSSSKTRSSQSASAFSLGFFKDHFVGEPSRLKKNSRLRAPPAQPVGVYTIPEGQDQEMAVKYSCSVWKEKVDDHPQVLLQAQLYEESFLPALAKSLSTILGADMTADDASLIYKMCGFEVSLYDDVSTWCQLLLQTENGGQRKGNGKDELVLDNFLKFEVLGDLEDYYTYGLGVPFNGFLGCKFGTSLLDSVELALTNDITAEGDGEEFFRGHFKFGHSESIMFISSFLGLYGQNGTALTADMTAEQLAKREFRSSLFAQFASNIAFEVFRAKKSSSSEPVGLIRLLVNEKPVLIPGCNTMLCEWSDFKRIITEAGAGCDFESCCGSPSAALPTNATCLSTSPIFKQ